jgi:hypothetical protein
MQLPPDLQRVDWSTVRRREEEKKVRKWKNINYEI